MLLYSVLVPAIQLICDNSMKPHPVCHYYSVSPRENHVLAFAKLMLVKATAMQQYKTGLHLKPDFQ